MLLAWSLSQEPSLVSSTSSSHTSRPKGSQTSVYVGFLSLYQLDDILTAHTDRIAGAHSEINNLKDALNRGEWPIDNYTDVNAVCDLIKAWFRVLPGGMFPGAHYTEILGAACTSC